MPITEQDVLDRLSKVRGPDRAGDLVSLGLVGGISVTGGQVVFSINVPAERAQELEPLRAAAQQSVERIEGIEKVIAVLTAEAAPGSGQNTPPPKPVHPGPGRAAAPPPMGRPGQGGPGQGGGPQPQREVEHVEAIVAVASGKGGVGKSTTSVNLALALAAEGLNIGILDADIYGPSMPRLLGTSDRPQARGRTLEPLSAYGVKVMSMGFLVEEDTPMIWRGPMVISALTQLLREVAWGTSDAPLDVLVVDMPPGTGDAQLTMAQQVPLAGAVIVSTPQDIALIDARKGLNMFRRVDVPILGIVENMSVHICPKCGHEEHIFGHGGAREEASRMGVPFLGEVPLHVDIRRQSDAGTPVMVSAPDGPHAEAYRAIARGVIERLAAEKGETGPSIVFE